MGCSAAACILWFFLNLRRSLAAGKAAALAGLTLVLGVLFGVIGARGVWLLCRINTRPAVFPFQYDQLSYYGGVAGVIAAAALAAKLSGQPVGKTLNTFAPMGALMAAAARFAEGFLGLMGVGTWMEEGIFFPVTVEFVYDEYYSEFYLAVFMLEGLFALIAMILSLCHGKEKDRFLRTLFYLCLPQVFCESLRAVSINWLFVRAEQLFCFVFCEGVLVWHAFRKGAKQFFSWVPALIGLLVCGLVITAEFALDGKILINDKAISHWIIYGFVLAGLAAMAAAEHKARKNS